MINEALPLAGPQHTRVVHHGGRDVRGTEASDGWHARTSTGGLGQQQRLRHMALHGGRSTQPHHVRHHKIRHGGPVGRSHPLGHQRPVAHHRKNRHGGVNPGQSHPLRHHRGAAGAAAITGGMATQGVLKNVATVARIAKQKGVSAATAVASMLVESGGDNRKIGDHGTSFGLFQLHRGGELGRLTPQQAFDPVTNANTALSEFARHRGLSPGAQAAAAERPKNRGQYAAKVNANLALAHRLLQQAGAE